MITPQIQQEVSSPIDQIAYCCLASPHVNALRLVSDLRTHTAGITGLLIWEGRLLIHWLEGSVQQIEALWAQVQCDVQQHCLVRLLHRQDAPERWFEDWQMRPTSRQEMMRVVREVKAQAGAQSDAQADGQVDALALQWQHAISTLSILLNPELTQFYAVQAQKDVAWQASTIAACDEAVAAC